MSRKRDSKSSNENDWASIVCQASYPSSQGSFRSSTENLFLGAHFSCRIAFCSQIFTFRSAIWPISDHASILSHIHREYSRSQSKKQGFATQPTYSELSQSVKHHKFSPDGSSQRGRKFVPCTKRCDVAIEQ